MVANGTVQKGVTVQDPFNRIVVVKKDFRRALNANIGTAVDFNTDVGTYRSIEAMIEATT